MTCFATMAICAFILGAGITAHDGHSATAGGILLLGCAALFMDGITRKWR